MTVDPDRIATVGHALKDRTNRWWTRPHVRVAVSELTDAEIACFPRHVSPGLRLVRRIARDYPPPLNLIMAHTIP
jgi:hypothetical protein